jgi:hypothetical protein
VASSRAGFKDISHKLKVSVVLHYAKKTCTVGYFNGVGLIH